VLPPQSPEGPSVQLLSSLGANASPRAPTTSKAGPSGSPLPYEIFGATWAVASGALPGERSCFLVDELFDGSQIWSPKGLFCTAAAQTASRWPRHEGIQQGLLARARGESSQILALGSVYDPPDTHQIHVLEHQGHCYNHSDALIATPTCSRYSDTQMP